MIFFLYFLKNDLPYHRFAVSVSRKIGKAVERNYIKRKMKEVFRLNQDIVEEKHDLWVVMKKRFDRKNGSEIGRLLVDALIKVNYKYKYKYNPRYR